MKGIIKPNIKLPKLLSKIILFSNKNKEKDKNSK